MTNEKMKPGQDQLDSQAGEKEFDPFANEKKDKSSAGAGIAWLALLLALALAALNGWQWWQARSGDEAATEQARGMQQIRDEQQGLSHQLNQLQGRQDSLERAGLENGLADLTTGLDRLQANDWANPEVRIKIAKPTKLWVAFKYGIL